MLLCQIHISNNNFVVFVVMAMVFVHRNKWPNWQTYLLPPKWHLFLATMKGMDSSSPLKYSHMDLSK